MTTFDKAMSGDERSIERYFFNSKGEARSDAEFEIIFNLGLDYRERLLQVAALREVAGSVPRRRKAAPVHVPFELLINAGDAIHARALGVGLD